MAVIKRSTKLGIRARACWQSSRFHPALKFQPRPKNRLRTAQQDTELSVIDGASQQTAPFFPAFYPGNE